MELQLNNNKISHIGEHTFAFASTSTQQLDIDLRYNSLNALSFDKTWYNKIHRPLHLRLTGNKISYLSEGTFSAFLNRNKNNTLFVDLNPFRCDCHAKWLLQDISFYKDKVVGMTCPDGRNIFEFQLAEFDHCPDN